MSNLNLDQVTTGQASKEATINQAIAELENAMTEMVTYDLSSSHTALLIDLQRNMRVHCTGAAGGTVLTLVAVKRALIISNGGSADLSVAMGSTTITLAAGTRQLVYCDGTANGLITVGSTGTGVPAGGSDGQVLTKVSGSPAWATPSTGGGGGGGGTSDTPFYRSTDIAIPIATNFTLVQTRTNATIANTTRGVLAKFTGSANNDQLIMRRTLPATPYTIKVFGVLLAELSRFTGWGIAHMDSGGKLSQYTLGGADGSFRFDLSDNSAIGVYAADTAYLNAITTQSPHSPTWLRLQDDGTNIYFDFGLDGENWHRVFQRGRTAYLTPAYVGPFVGVSQPTGSPEASLHLMSYSEAAGLV